MPRDADQFDFFVSYARTDDADGWITRFVEELLAEHRKFFGTRELVPFFDRSTIGGLDDWQQRIYHGLAASRLFLAFLSPSYFASPWCRREWRAWIDVEIAKHILSAGVAPLYIVEVPGFDNAGVTEQDVARRVAEFCDLPAPHEAFCKSAAPVVKELRRRQLNRVVPFYRQGIDALRHEELRSVLAELAKDLDHRAELVRVAAESANTVPPYNKRFSGRLDELLLLRERLKDDRAGVICGVHGLGGIGKTELAFAYAHAFASAYPGGRFLVPCEGKASLREAAMVLGDLFRDRIRDEDRMTPQTYFAAIAACLAERLDRLGHILLVLDNVTDPDLLTAEQTDALTALGPKLHLLATTRLSAPGHGNWLTLGELPEADSLALLEKHRPFADETEREAGRRLVRRLGGFALAVELAAAWLVVHPSATYSRLVEGLGLEDLETLAGDEEVELRRHNHERRLSAVLGPLLEGLTPAEHRTLEYAALLPPDHVPLAWLQGLATGDFPELSQPERLVDPWAELWQRLVRLALLSRAEGEENVPRVLRVHRLVQDLVRRELSLQELASRQQAVDQFLHHRVSVLENTTRWAEARWELEPLDALAGLWAETGHARAAWLLNHTGVQWHHLAEWSRAEPLMRRALAIWAQNLGADHPQLAIALNNLAALLQATNRLAEAEPLMRRALVLCEQMFGPDHPNVATALNRLALLLNATNRLTEADQLIRRALAIDEQSLGADHPEVARDLNNLALLLRVTNRLAEAEPLMRRALVIDEQSFGADHPNVAGGLSNLAQLLQATNRLTEAEPLMRRALAIDEESFGADHPGVARDLNNLAQLLQATNRLAEAEPLMRRALVIAEQSLGADHPDVAIQLNNLAQLLQVTNRLAEAEPLMRQALVIAEQSFGADHPNVARDLSNLALLLHATNRLAEAEPLYRRALVIDEHSFGADHPNVARDLNNLSGLLYATNRLAEAEAQSRRHLEICLKFTRATGHPHPRLQAAIGNYSGLLQAMGRDDQEVLTEINAIRKAYGVEPGGNS